MSPRPDVFIDALSESLKAELAKSKLEVGAEDIKKFDTAIESLKQTVLGSSLRDVNVGMERFYKTAQQKAQEVFDAQPRELNDTFLRFDLNSEEGREAYLKIGTSTLEHPRRNEERYVPYTTVKSLRLIINKPNERERKNTQKVVAQHIALSNDSVPAARVRIGNTLTNFAKDIDYASRKSPWKGGREAANQMRDITPRLLAAVERGRTPKTSHPVDNDEYMLWQELFRYIDSTYGDMEWKEFCKNILSRER